MCYANASRHCCLIFQMFFYQNTVENTSSSFLSLNLHGYMFVHGGCCRYAVFNGNKTGVQNFQDSFHSSRRKDETTSAETCESPSLVFSHSFQLEFSSMFSSNRTLKVIFILLSDYVHPPPCQTVSASRYRHSSPAGRSSDCFQFNYVST